MDIVNRLKKAASVLVASSSDLSNQANAMAAQRNTANNKENSVYDDSGQFSPDNPLTPQEQGREAWGYQYLTGSNINFTPRSENTGLVPFKVLKDLASNHDITALCIQMMIDQVVGDEWDIVAADKNDRKNHEKEIKQAKAFFYKPDKVHLFNDWLKPILYDSLYGDCACMFKRRTLSGKLYSLERIDGSTIKPLIDIYGRTPLPPYAAYQQVIYGVPRGSSRKGDSKSYGFTLDEISYRPRYPRTWTQYGQSPIEKILLKINIALRRDNFNLNFYTEGNSPDGGIYCFDNPTMTVDQIKQFTELFNTMMSGNLKERLKMKFMPKGTFIKTKDHEWDVKIDEWISRIVANAFGVNPQAFVSMVNRSTAQSQDAQQTDIGLTPFENFFEEWFTDIIQNDLGFTNLKFKYVDEKKEDAEVATKKYCDYVDRGIMKIDEVRSIIGLPPLTNLPDGTPAIIKVGNGIIPLTEDTLTSATNAAVQMYATGDTQVGNYENVQNKTSDKNNTKNGSQNDDISQENNPSDKVPAKQQKTAKKDIEAELIKFEKFSLNRLKKGIKNSRTFESDILSEQFCNKITSEIEKVNTADEIKEIFKAASSEENINNIIDEASEEIKNMFDDIYDEISSKKKDISQSDLDNNNTEEKVIALLLLLLKDYNFDKSTVEIFTPILEKFAGEFTQEAINSVKALGGKITKANIKDAVDNAVNKRVDFLKTSLTDVTKNKIGDALKDVTQIDQIDTAIKNIYGLSQERAELIANTEIKAMKNSVTIEIAKKSDKVAGVLVSDGIEFDTPCIEANGQVWSLDYAGNNVLQHPHCVRQFEMITQEQVDEHGGFDEE